VTKTEPLAGEKALCMDDTAGASNDPALLADPICNSMDSLTWSERNIPDGTLLLTIDDEIHSVVLKEVGTKTSLTEASLYPNKLPTTVTEILPDAGKFPGIISDG